MRSLLILFCRIFAIEVHRLCLAQNKKHNGKPLYDKQINYFLSLTTLHGSLDNRRNWYYFKKNSKAKIASEIALNLNFHWIKIKLVLLLFFRQE